MDGSAVDAWFPPPVWPIGDRWGCSAPPPSVRLRWLHVWRNGIARSP